MISKKEAVEITDASKLLLANPQRVQLLRFLKEADQHILEAAGHGKNKAIWTVGTDEHKEAILNALIAEGFDASFSLGSFTVEW